MKKILIILIASGISYTASSQNMGVDQSNPAEKLHINGNLRVSTGQINSDGEDLRLMGGVRSDDNSYEWIGFYSGGVRQGIFLYDGAWGGANGLTNEFSITAENGNHLTLNTGSGENILLMPKGSGKVGIGTTSPAQLLDVNGTIETNALKFPDGSVQSTAPKLLNAYFAMTPATRQTVYGNAPVAINGLSITLTPASSSSRFVIIAVVNGSFYYVCSTLLYRNGSKVQTHGGNTNEPGSQVTTYGLGNNSYMQQHVVNYIDAPNTTSSVTYDIRVTSGWAGANYTTYVNDRSSNDMRTRSTLTILEYVQ